MKIEEQVLSIEQAKHLQELGMDMSDAAFCWLPLNEETLFIPVKYIYKDDEGKEILTYTLQEVLQHLGEGVSLTHLEGNIWYLDIYIDGEEVRFGACDALTVAYLSLVSKLENEQMEDKK